MDNQAHSKALFDALQPRTPKGQMDQEMSAIISKWEKEYEEAFSIFISPNPDTEKCYDVLDCLCDRWQGVKFPTRYGIWADHLAMRCLLLGVMSLLLEAEVKNLHRPEDGEEVLGMLTQAHSFSKSLQDRHWRRPEDFEGMQSLVTLDDINTIDESISKNIKHCKEAYYAPAVDTQHSRGLELSDGWMEAPVFGKEQKKRESKARRAFRWNKFQSILKDGVMGSSKQKGYSLLGGDGN
ncbi:MAG: hypothetical protein Q9182_001949 [Xanthomendoza sp. 2 TL-2023]